ncbi:adenylosuccinate synthetase [Methylacidiphilum kamchatkense Kam1]|uniref:Adenylosuccinate synthetase n=1 Tax=Methylacidiphilum kamchatkense Kam1 TaxID=1202785 RepID=A0A0C1RU90_9BACT|nr:adenylosuccinate synthase [Methylacidiphilum kamchatkense]KIE58561.1 adenylosuccinate synthetase [Methylacidiphilum kamchatkense Kam1]QDQ41273.1 adenylosuccinate synthetase [Methylacidiphilum kamchatkense Kam1]
MNSVLVGAQWGDEGKGKIIDFLTQDVDVVVRCQGGDNAGHTVEVHDEKFVLHLIPSGILWPDKFCLLGSGMVIDPVSLVDEIKNIEKRGIEIRSRLFISETAHMVFPYHRIIDELLERRRGKGRIGTTKKGIGPAYADKVSRVGLRILDLLDRKKFSEKLKILVEEKNRYINFLGGEPVLWNEIADAYLAAADEIASMVTNTTLWLHEASLSRKKILFESAQGTFLDIDFGTYPFVTSSNTTAGGAITGSGLPPHKISRVIGCMKAYTTRVGEGPFPVENAELSNMLHSTGREFGSTTGRARRCGWFDGVLARYASLINGFHEVAVTNLDGLDTIEKIPICVAYEYKGKILKYPPNSVEQLEECIPIYEEMPGWLEYTGGVRCFKELPKAAQEYLKKLGVLVGAPIKIVSVGADREQTFFVD